jgi:hypothetical protein
VAGRLFVIPHELELNAIRKYHDNTLEALTHYFSPSSPAYQRDFLEIFSLPEEAAKQESDNRSRETDRRSCLILLSSLEAHFQVDCQLRRKRRLKDDVSKYLSALEPDSRGRLQLDQQIFEGWKLSHKQLIGHLRGAFKLRHWLAHGCFWTPKNIPREYDFEELYLMAVAINRILITK